MKKSIFLSALMVCMSFFVNAQTGTQAATGTKTTKTSTTATHANHAPKQAGDTTKRVHTKDAGATGTTGAKTKKDGTPDMRYKENKEAKGASGSTGAKMKKDGTPDKRYKENKDTTKVKK